MGDEKGSKGVAASTGGHSGGLRPEPVPVSAVPAPAVNAALLELAERVRAAEGPDRQLDGDIHWLLFGGRTGAEAGFSPKGGIDRIFNDPEAPNLGLLVPYQFTGNVADAERALPGPEWPEWQVTRRYCTGYHASVGMGDDGVGCETAALALTEAALRARARGQ